MQFRGRACRAAPLILLIFVTACAGSTQPTATPPPTQALNPAPPTATAPAVQATTTLTLPPSAADVARTATASAPTPDPTQQSRAAQTRLALETVAAETDRPTSDFKLAALTGVRAGREIDGCGRAQSGMALASVLQDSTVTEVLIDGSAAQICGVYDLYDERPELFLTLDPIAADLTSLAVDRAARSAGAAPEDVIIGSVRPIEWTTAAEACEASAAAPGTAVAGSAAGYRIVLMVGEREFVYHTDFDRLFPCSTA